MFLLLCPSLLLIRRTKLSSKTVGSETSEIPCEESLLVYSSVSMVFVSVARDRLCNTSTFEANRRRGDCLGSISSVGNQEPWHL